MKLLEEAFDAASAYAQARAADPGLALDNRWEAILPALPKPGSARSTQRQVFIHADEGAQIRWALDFAER